MKFKFNPNLTIKRMLWGLVLIGIICVLALWATSLGSNNTLIESQKRLTGIVIPLDNSTQAIKSAAMNFIIRKYVITDVESMEKLEELMEERKQFEIAFTNSVKQLKSLSTHPQLNKASAIIKHLEKDYTEILQKDNKIVDHVRSRIQIQNQIKKGVRTLDVTGARLHKNAAIISRKIEVAIQNKVENPDENPASPETTVEGVIAGLTRAQVVSNDMRLAVSFLTDYGRQILLATNAEKIANIKDMKIENASEMFVTSLAFLKLGIAESLGFSDFVETMEKDFAMVKDVLIGEENSMADLKGQWLADSKLLEKRNVEFEELALAMTRNLDNLQKLADSVRNNAEKQAVQTSNTAKGIIWVVTVIAVIFMLVTGLVITRRILRPINKLFNFADTLAQGDLTAEIDKEHNDEIGNLISKLSEMAHTLNTLIGQVQRSGIQVTSSATELSATSKQQEAVMKTQLESTNYVVKSIGEISNVSAELVETVQKVAGMSEQTAEFASTGQTDLAQMEEAVHHMENASKSISGKLEAINEKAANITSVVTTITKVADQTNLLSLNAAIEAEKAGEYGRGFTVVAREIRRLADQTAVATLDIEQMVQEMQSAVSAGVMEMDAFIAEVQRSAENVGKISTQLSRIIEQVQKLSPSFEGVNESMQFQSENAQKINNSMLNLSEEMQQTVESLQESFMAIEQLNDAARGLQNEVSRFKLI